MKKAELQEKLQYFNQEDAAISVEMYLQYLDEENKLQTFLPALDETHLNPAITKVITSFMRNKFFSENENYTYEVVSANSSEASDVRQVFHINKKDIPKADEIFKAVINDEAIDLPNNITLEDIWAYIYKVSFNGSIAYLFRKNSNLLLLRKDKTYNLFFSNNKLQLFDRDLLRLTPKVDVLLIGEELIIIDRSEFEKIFDYVGAMQSSADKNVQIINTSKLIEDTQKIAELSKNKNTLRKLLNINPKSKIFQKQPAQIIRLAKKYDVEFEMTTDGKKLVITTKKAAIKFIELLNDDYLKSEFSENLYKTKGKAKI